MDDFCPTCDTVVLIDWHTDDRTGWDIHDACGTALVPHDKYDAPEEPGRA